MRALGKAESKEVEQESLLLEYPTAYILGPYLVFMASTINNYEGTLSLKLIQQLRENPCPSFTKEAPAPANSRIHRPERLRGRTDREVAQHAAVPGRDVSVQPQNVNSSTTSVSPTGSRRSSFSTLSLSPYPTSPLTHLADRFWKRGGYVP